MWRSGQTSLRKYRVATISKAFFWDVYLKDLTRKIPFDQALCSFCCASLELTLSWAYSQDAWLHKGGQARLSAMRWLVRCFNLSTPARTSPFFSSIWISSSRENRVSVCILTSSLASAPHCADFSTYFSEANIRLMANVWLHRWKLLCQHQRWYRNLSKQSMQSLRLVPRRHHRKLHLLLPKIRTSRAKHRVRSSTFRRFEYTLPQPASTLWYYSPWFSHSLTWSVGARTVFTTIPDTTLSPFRI